MQKRRITITVGVVLLVMAACGLLIRLQSVQEVVREGIVLPVYFVVWLAWLFLRSIDQVVIWGIGLIVLALVLIYGLAAAWTKKTPQLSKESLEGPRRPIAAPPPRTYGRVKFWNNRIESLYSQGLSNDFAAHEFRRLTQGVEAFSGRGFSRPLENESSADLQTFFLPANSISNESLPSPQTWRQRLAAWLQRTPPPGPVPLGDTLARLCTFLEEKLEIEHDDSN